MTNIAKILVYVFTASILFSSCSFEKRLYTKGYHIDWASKSHTAENGSVAPNSRKSQNETSAFNNTLNVVETKKASTSQDFVSSVNTNNPTENNSYVLASEKTLVAPSLSNTQTPNQTFGSSSPETKVSAADVLPKNKKLIKKLIRRGTDDTVLLVILALLIPPLAMFFYEGENWTDRCTLNLILTLLCWLPGVIHALFVILDNR
ncbi:MAG: YqaE/Pmp3 family membrane protein [Arcticibacter sp.]